MVKWIFYVLSRNVGVSGPRNFVKQMRFPEQFLRIKKQNGRINQSNQYK